VIRLIAVSTLLLGCASLVLAATTIGPEIDASSGSAAVALISGGLLVLRARRKK